MRRSASTVVVLVVLTLGIASVAQAQFGGGREARRATYPENMGISGPPPLPPTIAAIALDRAADLGLADSQRVAIEAIRRAQDSINFPRTRALDSLRPTRRPANGVNDLSQEQRDEMEQRRTAITLILDGMRETNGAMRTKVLALLTPEQQKRASDWEDDARKKAEDEGRKRSRAFTSGGDSRGRRPQED